MRNTILTPHFTLLEFTESATARKYGIENIPTPEVKENLKRLCVNTLEPLREELGVPIIITSGYRCSELNNRMAGHARKSQHLLGQAADFYVAPGAGAGFKFVASRQSAHARDNSSKLDSPLAQSQTSGSKFQGAGGKGLSHQELLTLAVRQILISPEIDFDQLILYPTFIHVSYVSRERNRRKLNKASGNGTYCALSRTEALLIK